MINAPRTGGSFIGFGETMHGTAEVHELPIGFRILHFLLEGNDRFRRYVFVVGAIHHKHGSFYVTHFGRRQFAGKIPVKRSHAGNICTTACKIQYYGTAKTETDCTNIPGIDRRFLFRSL